MDKFVSITSKVMPLPIKDIDTDMIIPAEFLKQVSKEGFGKYVFSILKKTYPDFPMNKEEFKDAKIIVADSNFGCGSSREHAVWAIKDAGFDVIISKSFADIFSGNAGKNGLVLIKLEDDIVEKLLMDSKNGDYEISVDLDKQLISLPNAEKIQFEYDPFRKHCILNGLDDIDYILSAKN